MDSNCQQHSGVLVRLDHLESRQTGQERRVTQLELGRGAAVGRFVWILVTAAVTCAVTTFVSLLIARAAGG